MLIKLTSVVIFAVCWGSSLEMKDGGWGKMLVRWRRLLSEVLFEVSWLGCMKVNLLWGQRRVTEADGSFLFKRVRRLVSLGLNKQSEYEG